jgi:lysylphosphatidylglycerol synthetase-like protein (DUF2156 family)
MAGKKTLFPYVLLSLIFSLGAGLADIKYKEIYISVLLIIVFTLMLAFFRPKHFLIWAIIVGLGIIFVRLVAWAVDFQISSNIPAALLALIPAFIGAYAGSFVSKHRKQ